MQKLTAISCKLIPVFCCQLYIFSSHMTLGKAVGISRPLFLHPKPDFFLACFLCPGNDVARFSFLVFLNIHKAIWDPCLESILNT